MSLEAFFAVASVVSTVSSLAVADDVKRVSVNGYESPTLKQDRVSASYLCTVAYKTTECGASSFDSGKLPYCFVGESHYL